MKRVNIFVGRFQPFTAGHYKCVLEAKARTGLPTVICMMNIPESKLDKKHPFTTEMLVDLYSDLFRSDKNIADVVPVASADIVKIGQLLNSMGYEIAAWTCGSDRVDTYRRMSTNYHDQAGLSDDFELVEVMRDETSEENISATKVRNCLLDDDRAGFDRMTPMGPNKDVLYNTLRRQIRKVYKLPERYYSSLERRVRILEKKLYRLMK